MKTETGITFYDRTGGEAPRLFRRNSPAVGCVIMASGMSRRFGSSKLLADFDGRPMILRALEATQALSERRVVVTRDAEAAALCRLHGAQVILHAMPSRSDTVRLGTEAMEDMDGCMFLPADQPLLRTQTVNRLVRCWQEAPEKILRPFCGDTPGTPVIFPKWAFDELKRLPEGKGGSWVIGNHPDMAAGMQIGDPYELADADTPQALAALLKRKRGG